MMIELRALATGIMAGISYATSGYIRAVSKGESFDIKKFLKGIMVGVCIGAISAIMGIPLPSAEMLLSQIGATAIIDKLASAIYERLSKI